VTLRYRLAYAISPDRETWVERIERGCVALEAACRSSPLMTSQEAEKADRSVADRRKYLRASLTRSGRPFALTNGRSGGIKPGGDSADSAYVGAGGQFYERGETVYRFNISFHADDWSECERIFVSVGDAVEAYSAIVNPSEVSQRLRCFEGLVSGHSAFLSRQESMRAGAEASMREGEKLRAGLAAIGRHLPLLDEHILVGRSHPAQPTELGWINYWSAQTCEYLGFPNPERDRDLLAHSYRTPGGAWLVKLCPDPLDLGRPEHLAVFADTYARFPKLGVRATEKHADEPLAVGFPQNTVFVRETKVWYVVERLVSFFQERGLQVVERIPKGARRALTVGLFPGAPDWTIVKTIPEEFLAEKPPGVEEPRLVELCRAIQREGFMLNVYNEVEALLLETDMNGRSHISGFREVEEQRAGDPSDQVFTGSSIVNFELLPIHLDMLDLDDSGQLAQQLYTEFGGGNFDLCDNKRFSAALDRKLLQERQGVKLHFISGPATKSGE
jgi:hypothetical protein